MCVDASGSIPSCGVCKRIPIQEVALPTAFVPPVTEQRAVTGGQVVGAAG
jgi:hypothetical protein